MEKYFRNLFYSLVETENKKKIQQLTSIPPEITFGILTISGGIEVN